MRGIPFAELKVGDQGSLSKTVSEHDIYTYAGLTGDFNPIHVNAEFAKGTMFKERIAHGMPLFGNLAPGMVIQHDADGFILCFLLLGMDQPFIDMDALLLGLFKGFFP